MPESSDLAKARREAAILLGLDPARSMCPADSLRVDLVSTLRLTIDAAAENVLEGGWADIARLVGAVEQLQKLLPRAATEAPSHRADPREALLKLILEQRERAGIPDEGISESAGEIAALRAENERLRRAAGLAVAHAACGAPTEADVDIVPPGEIADRDPGMRPGPDDPAAPTVIEATAAPAAEDGVDLRYGFDDRPEPWKNYVQPDGSISPTPFGGSKKYWGPV